MRQEDQDFADFVLSTVTQDVRWIGEASSELFDNIDRHINLVADSIRDSIHGSTWIPENIKPSLPIPPRPTPPVIPITSLTRFHQWMNQNRALTAAVLAFVGTSAFLLWRRRGFYRQKRRARRATTGAKIEVVILVGSAYSPITKSLAIDLERRGFLVYIPVGSFEEEAAISQLRLADIQALNFDITSTESTADMLDKFSEHLTNPHRHGTSHLHLASLVLLPPYSSLYPVAPISSLPSHVWSDILNTHILYPISLIHTFLPLLLSNATPPGSQKHPTLVLLTPSNIPSLCPPYHAAESLTTNALASYFTTLCSELSTLLQPTHLRLGAFDFDPPANPTRRDVALARRSFYETSPISNSLSPARFSLPTMLYSPMKRSKGSSLRELHNGVFDAIVGQSSGTVFVGSGARAYALIGAWAPRTLIDWMMNLRGDAGWKPLQSGQRRHSWQSGSDSERTGRSAEWEKVDDT